jgi:hypothetical protein
MRLLSMSLGKIGKFRGMLATCLYRRQVVAISDLADRKINLWTKFMNPALLLSPRLKDEVNLRSEESFVI